MKLKRHHSEFLESIESSWKGHEHFAVWLAKKMDASIVVDLGFDRGLSTVAFAMGSRGHTYGIDWFNKTNHSKKTCAMDSAFCTVTEALQMKLVKNVHLIVGPFADVSKGWKKQIDLLHIDWAHSYLDVKEQYAAWSPFLKENGALLLHDVEAYPDETGKFFHELPFPKLLFPHCKGLGVVSKNTALLEEISKRWHSTEAIAKLPDPGKSMILRQFAKAAPAFIPLPDTYSRE